MRRLVSLVLCLCVVPGLARSSSYIRVVASVPDSNAVNCFGMKQGSAPVTLHTRVVGMPPPWVYVLEESTTVAVGGLYARCWDVTRPFPPILPYKMVTTWTSRSGPGQYARSCRDKSVPAYIRTGLCP